MKNLMFILLVCIMFGDYFVRTDNIVWLRTVENVAQIKLIDGKSIIKKFGTPEEAKWYIEKIVNQVNKSQEEK